MSTYEKERFVLCLVSAVLLAAVVIAGYCALRKDPLVLRPSYSASDRADMTSLVKAFK